MTSTRRRFLRQVGTASAAFLFAGCSFPGPADDDALPIGHVDAGSLDAILRSIDDRGEPHYLRAARAYVSRFPPDALSEARTIYPAEVVPLLVAGVVVLNEKCTHLGCRLPFCESSQWFECPCHGAKFNRVGEKKDGPAPRGMDFAPARIDGGRLLVDTTRVVRGTPLNTNTTKQRQEGPACV